MTRVYLSGKITGLTKEEYTRNFAVAEQHYLTAGFVLINRGGPYFHKLCEVNEISMADVTKAETEATRLEFPYLHRRDNLVK